MYQNKNKTTMALKKIQQMVDINGNPLGIVGFSASENLDGSTNADQSAAINSVAVRIAATDGDVRFAIGDDPVADGDCPIIFEGTDLYQPIEPGQKVSVFGGKANVCTVNFE